MRTKLIDKIPVIIQVLLATLGTYGLCHLGQWMGIEKASYTVLSLCFFIVVYFGLEQVKREYAQVLEKKNLKRRVCFSGLVAFLFAFALLVGYQLQVTGITEGGYRGKGLLILRSVCLAIAFYPFSNLLFCGVEKIKPVVVGEQKRVWKPAVVFGVCAVFVFVCLIPVWMAFYPIIMSYDFHRQINEAYNGFAYFYPYQPIAHTWVIWVFLQLGTAIGSLEAGFSYMALFQIVLYALVTGYACSMIYRIVPKKWVVAIVAFFFGVFPFNTVLVVCTTKDVLFTIQFLLFFLLLLERFLFCKEKAEEVKTKKVFQKKYVLDVLIVIVGCLMMQFRNNAFYAVAVFMVLFLILAAKKERLHILILCVLLIVGGKVTGAAITEAIGTQIPSAKVEMFSVPIQQFARVGFFHEDEIDASLAAEMEDYVPLELCEYYNPPLADTIKSGVPDEYYTKEYGKLLSFWVRMAVKYPNEFIDAFLELTRGYWFLDDTSWAENLGSGVESRMGAIFTYNSSASMQTGESIEHVSKWPWLENKLLEIVSGNAFYDWPIISIVFRSAFYPWCLFLTMLAYLYKKQKKQFTFSLLIFLYFGTMLLGPVVQLRYLFPVMLTVPMLLALLFLRDEEQETL